MRVLGACAVVALTIAAGPAWAGQAVVLSSAGTDAWPTGTVLSDTENLSVPEHGRLVVITENGLKVQVDGPFEGSIAEQLDTGADKAGAAVDVIRALSKLFTRPGFTTQALGAFRSFGEPALADPWAFDIGTGGAVCYPAGGAPNLWRASARRDDTVVIRGGGGAARFTLPKGQAIQPWPVEVPMKDGADYTLTGESGRVVTVTAHAVPADMPTRMHIAAWMSENGCDSQATLLVVSADIDKLLEGLAQSGKF
ncbi:MAG: hypothetical protein HQL35_14180 [Alphaproteobacteria bacterium]|nr:hypothetical protein [Alphaproteobacteria bacterium]